MFMVLNDVHFVKALCAAVLLPVVRIPFKSSLLMPFRVVPRRWIGQVLLSGLDDMRLHTDPTDFALLLADRLTTNREDLEEHAQGPVGWVHERKSRKFKSGAKPAVKQN